MKKILYIFALIGLASCTPYNPSSISRGFPKEYNLAYQEIYGQCYDSVPYSVVALDLYSEGLSLNEDHRIQGSGYNLYLSDIFVPDSLLTEGSFKSDTSALPFTFLPGHDYEGTPHGIYILNIDSGKIAQIQVVDSGSFIYRNDSLLFTLYYHVGSGLYPYKYTYSPTFSGVLIPWLKK